MKTPAKCLVLGLAALLVAAPAVFAGGLPDLIPREVLFGNPERTLPQVSPDGTFLAYIAPDQGVLNVWVRTIGKTNDRVITKDRDRGIRATTSETVIPTSSPCMPSRLSRRSRS